MLISLRNILKPREVDEWKSNGSGAGLVEVKTALPAGTNLLGKVGIDQATANANEVVVKSITAGTNIIGKVGIDQTTPGTTNAVSITGTVTMGAPASVNVTTASTTVKAANASRKYLLIQNISDTMVDLNIGGTAVAATGIRLAPGSATAPGGSYEMSAAMGNLSTAVVNGIHAGVGNKAVIVVEGV